MKDIALVIMAAGIGSRYGAGIKQLQKVGKNDEIIIDYSIHDALEAGFTKVIFIIRKDIEKDFKDAIGSRIEQICPVDYVFQAVDDLPEGFSCPDGRTKPWGTGQAVLACKGVLDVPFAVVNADDYYGKTAFKVVHDYLADHYGENGRYCMAGFQIANTLSDNGTVTRGLAKKDADEMLITVTETSGLIRGADGVIVDEAGNAVDEDTLVSMNMWGLTPEFLDVLEKGFAEFLADESGNPMKKEYLLPAVIDGMLQAGEATVAVLPTPDKWFGVTYAEDKDSVVAAFADLIKQGVYNEKLWS